MGFISNPEFYVNKHKVTQVFLTLGLSYIKSGHRVRLLKNRFLSLAYLDGWSRLALQRPI